MRKLFFIIAIVCLSCFYLSCETEGNNDNKDKITYSKSDYLLELGRFAGLDEETEWQIIQAYYTKSDGGNLTINDVWVEDYYGSYCPNYLLPDVPVAQFDLVRTELLDPQNQIVAAVRMGATGMDYGIGQRDVILRITGTRRVVIRYYDNSTILFWDRGKLYDIEKDLGYLQNLLAESAILAIVNQHNGLDSQTDIMVREAIGKTMLTGWPVEDYVFISMNYLGTYNGYTAITLYSGAPSPAVYNQLIDDVLFAHPYYQQRAIASKDGAIFKLEDLYEQGIITHENLVEMAYFHMPVEWGK